MPEVPPPSREDDLIGKTVGYLARGIFARLLCILLSQNLRILYVLRVEKVASNDQLTVLHPSEPKATIAAEAGAFDHCGRLISAGAPGVALRRRAILRRCRRYPHWRDRSRAWRRTCAVRCSLPVNGGRPEVGDRDADALGPGGGLRFEPVLGISACGKRKQKGKSVAGKAFHSFLC